MAKRYSILSKSNTYKNNKGVCRVKAKDGTLIWLRPVKLDDVDDIFEYASTDKVGPMAGWTPHKDKEETTRIVESWLIEGDINFSPSDKEIVYAIVYDKDGSYKNGGKVIGTIGITIGDKSRKYDNPIVKQLYTKHKRIAQLGIVLSEDYWGLGIATEVLKHEIRYLLEEDIVDVVVGCCYDANMGSAKAQEKAGLKVVGNFTRDKAWYNTDCKTMTVRALTQQEWFDENNYKG